MGEVSDPPGAESGEAHERHRRQHAPWRADRVPRAAHVGPAPAGGAVPLRPVRRGRARLDGLAQHLRGGALRRRHGHARRGEARDRLQARFGPGGPDVRRHAARAQDPRHRGLGPRAAGAAEDPGHDPVGRAAGRHGGRRDGAAVPRRVLVARRPSRAAEANPGRRDGDGRPAAPTGDAAARARPGHAAGRREDPSLQHRRDPVPGEGRDPAHHRLGHHRVGQDRADLGPGRPGPRARGALRDLRQDGELHAGLPRPLPRRADESPRRKGAALVALPRGAGPPRLRHDGRRAHPPAEGHRGPVLGHRGAPALLHRGGRAPAAGRDPERGAGRPPAQGRPDGAVRGDGGHRRPVHRRSREPEDGALRAAPC